MQPLVWLGMAWRDICTAKFTSLCHGVALTCAGAAIVAYAWDKFWLLVGALSGFLVIAPMLATSLYALSRAIERNEPARWTVIVQTWAHWQHQRVHGHMTHYWRMVRFGMLLAAAATTWVLTSASLITLWAPSPVQTPMDFVHYVVLAPQGWLFEVWLALGAVLAAPLFASSVITMPMLLDQRTDVRTAVLTSWAVVLANPGVMAWWAALILGFTLLGLASGLLGLVFVVPMLGHASWHAYRDLVPSASLKHLETQAAPNPTNTA